MDEVGMSVTFNKNSIVLVNVETGQEIIPNNDQVYVNLVGDYEFVCDELTGKICYVEGLFPVIPEAPSFFNNYVVREYHHKIINGWGIVGDFLSEDFQDYINGGPKRYNDWRILTLEYLEQLRFLRNKILTDTEENVDEK